MRRLYAILLAALVLAACAEQPSPRQSHAIEPTPDRPLLLVTIDTLRWDALGSYGAETETPALDALAARGLRAEHAVAHAVVTLPSHATILTGLDPSRHGVHSNEGHRLGESAETLAERLREAGYATGAFVGAFPVDSQFGLDQGFDVYDDDLGQEEIEGGPSVGGANVERPAGEVVASALEWIESRRGPWFAWVHVYDPHDPYEAPEPFGSRYAHDSYAGEVAYVDSALAPLLEEAEERGAMVAVTADHGEGLGDHGEETHGLFAYASTLRVPLILAGIEGPAAGTVLPDRLRHIDLMPTLLEALGLPLDGLQGISLSGAAGSEPLAAHESYFEALTPYLDWGWRPLRGLYAGTVKYLDLPIRDRGWPPLHGIYSDDLKFIDLPIPELYDVAEDPGELVNLAEERPGDVERLRERLREHMASGGEPDATEVVEDEATLERLRALGYLGGGGAGPAEGIDIDDYSTVDDPKRLIEVEQTIQEAIRAMRREGGEPEAIRLLEGVLRRRPDLVRAWSLLASVRQRDGGVAAEVEVFERAVAERIEAPYVLERLARGYAELGRIAEAAETTRRGLREDPDNAPLLGLQASLLAQGGRIEEAERTFGRALELAPDDPDLHAGRGTLLLSTGRPGEAERAFRRALELNPALAEAHNGLGVLASSAGDLRAAVDHWRAALESSPDQPFVLYNLGITLERLGRPAEAAAALERYLQLNPGDREARSRLQRLRDSIQG